jgi:ABC-2 type transport system permease protein
MFNTNLLMQFRNRAAMFWNLAFPIGMMLLFGALFSSSSFKANENVSNSPELNFASYLVPGLIVLAAMSNGMIGYAGAMAVYREKGIFRRIRTTPMNIATFLSAKILVQAIFVIVQAIILTIVGMLVFGATIDWSSLPLGIVEVVLIGLMFVAIGQMIASIFRKSETVSIVTQMFNTPFMLLGGLLIPLSQFSDVPVLPQIGSVLPTGAAVNILRPTISPEPFKHISDVQGVLLLPLWVSFAIVAAYLVVSVITAARFFKWEV